MEARASAIVVVTTLVSELNTAPGELFDRQSLVLLMLQPADVSAALREGYERAWIKPLFGDFWELTPLGYAVGRKLAGFAL